LQKILHLPEADRRGKLMGRRFGLAIDQVQNKPQGIFKPGNLNDRLIFPVATYEYTIFPLYIFS